MHKGVGNWEGSPPPPNPPPPGKPVRTIYEASIIDV